MLFLLRISVFGNKKRYSVRKLFENAPDPIQSTARESKYGIDHRCLLAIPLLLAGRPPNLLVLARKLVLGGAPGCDHRIQLFRGDALRLHFGLPVSFLRRDGKPGVSP